MRLYNKVQVLKILNQHLGVYPTPMNLNWNWSWGSLSGLLLASQIVTGILLAMHYVGHVDHAFASVQHLMVDVPSGVILRYAHANGASLFFTVVYLHVLRGIYYSSGTQPREIVWISGVVILLLMIITAFIGYVLPWGQMSFWGATVITSLATVIPVVGKQIVYWLWGGFSIDHPTLNRFYSFHYTLPFLLAGLSIFHIAALHQYGSTNPLGINTQGSTIHFGTYFASKDLLAFLFLLLVFAILVFFYPEYLGQLNSSFLNKDWVAVLFGNKLDYNNAICWNNLYIPLLSARLISVFAVQRQTPNSATILKTGQGQSAGNNILMLNRQLPKPVLPCKQGSTVGWYGRTCPTYRLAGLAPVGGLPLSLPFYPPSILEKPPVRGVTRGRYIGSSETTRVTSYSKPLPPYDIFGSWLAGLIDGDGSLLLSGSKKVVSVEITLDAKDIQCLHKIKATLGFGSITKRSGVNAYRYRVYKKEHVLTILHLINGYLLTASKHAQLIKLCSFYGPNITPFIPDYPTSLLIIKNSSWLAGFFDAEGHFTVMNKFTLSCNLAQKDKLILESIKDSLQLGHVRYDKSWDGWIYTISNKEGIRFILDLFTTSGTQMGRCTLKYLDVCTFKRLLY